MALRSGKMPTTSVRRRISLLSRSRVIWSPAVGVVDVRHEASGSLGLLSGRGYLQPSRKQSLRRKSACYTGGFAGLVA